MKKVMKKFISGMLSMVILCITQTSVCVYAQDNTKVKEKEANVLFDLDFEGYTFSGGAVTAGLNRMAGTRFFPERIDSEHGTGVAVSTSTNAFFLKQLDNPVSQGCWHIGFEYYTNSTDGRIHLRTANTQGVYNVICGRETTVMGMYPGLVGYSLTGNTVKSEANKWKSFDVWFDFEGRKVYLYIDNKYVDSYNMPGSLDSIAEVNMRAVTIGNSEIVQVIDNFRMVEADKSGLEFLKNEGKAIPEAILADVSCNITSSQIGNIFYDFNSVSLNTTVKNKLEEEYKGKIKYTITKPNKEIIWESEEELIIPAGEVFSKTINPRIDKFDIYTLNMTVESLKNSANKIHFAREFSVANRMKGKRKNDRFGIVSHNQNLDRSQPDESFPIMDALGIGNVREAFYIDRMTKDNTGKYVYTGDRAKMYEKMIKYCKEFDIDILAFVTLGNFGNFGEKNPDKEDYQKRIRDLVEWLQSTGVVIGYQLGNEVNNHGRQNKYPVEVHVEEWLKPFYETAKSVDENAKVILCSTSRADAGWIEMIFRAGGDKYLDGVSFHPYTGSAAPETQKWGISACEVKERVNELGHPDMLLYATEGHVTSSNEYVSEQQQGESLVRLYASNLAYGVSDILFTYQIQTWDYIDTNIEHKYGIIRGWDVDNKNGAKPAYLAGCNYHAMTDNQEYKEYIKKDDIYMHHFEGNEGNGDTLMMYADRDIIPVSVNIGVNTGIMYDIYGNATEIHSDDGIFTFYLTDAPIYFKADFEKAEISDLKVLADETLITMPAGNYGEYNLEFDKSFDADIYAREHVNAKLETNEKGAKITINPSKVPDVTDYYGRNHNVGEDIFRDYITVMLKKDNKVYTVVNLGVNYLKKSVETNISFRPYDDVTKKHFVGEVTVKNTSENPVSGTLKLLSPEVLAEKFGEKRIENLGFNESESFTFNIPVTMNEMSVKYNGVFKADNGNEYPFYMTSSPHSTNYSVPNATKLRVLNKTDKKLVIDGNVTEEEWSDGLWQKFGASDVSEVEQFVIDGVVIKADERGRTGVKSDFGGRMYALWDDEFLYVAAVVVDDIHYQKEQPVAFFRDDVLSVYTEKTEVQRHNTRFDFALSDFLGKPWCFLNWSPVWESFNAKEMPPDENGVNYAIKREGLTTIYEAQIPWTDLIWGGVKEYDNFSFMMQVHDYDEFRDKTTTAVAWTCLVEQEK